MSNTEKECKVAPNGKHCLHAKTFYWQWNGAVDRTQVCCWCGQDIAVHGEFLPTYQPNTWITTTTVPANTQWVNVPATWTNASTTGTYTLVPSGSVGTGG